MVITDYTAYGDVRAVLGVSDEELKDATLALEVYANHLELELEDIHATLPAQYAAVKALPEGERTAVQQKFYKLARLFATYSVARQLVSGLPMFGPKDITDGKAGFSRFADSPYVKVIEEVKAEYDRLLLALDKVFGDLISVAVTAPQRTYVAVVGQGTDRVTGA